MNTPEELTISDLVPLMYRSRRARFGLSGEIVSRTTESGPNVWEDRESFEVAPDGRYRSEVIDAEGDREVQEGVVSGSYRPVPSLMVRAFRLVPDFDLRITGRSEFLGRPVIAISGVPRLAIGGQRERVSGLFDAELGIFLSYRWFSPSQTESAEFTRLAVTPTKPPGLAPEPGPPLPSSAHSGASSSEDAEPALTDDQVNLLYRSDLEPQRFTARLSEHTDGPTMMRLVRETIATTKLGSRTQWLWRPSDDDAFQNGEWAARLAVAMPGRYVIEAITDPGSRPTRISCNGQRLWRSYPDRVAVRAAEPLPPSFAAIIDPAWLLATNVSVIGDAVVDGRPALHVRATGDCLPSHSGPLSRTPILADQVDVFIDRALGVCLRQVSSCQGHLIMRMELSDLTTAVDSAAFDYAPPPGMKVITGGLLAEWGETPASLAMHVAKGLAGTAFEVGRRWMTRTDRPESDA
ncbi:MAG: hypothetical protein LBV34_08870 [Nocardiopsaceae bacterium]|jgi:hypothetical protein|nr:hypothetical protein [Nocardiopsaceae bacterium]